MRDWSEHIIKAKKNLLKAENSLNLRRDAEGVAAILLAMDDLNEIVDILDEKWDRP